METKTKTCLSDTVKKVGALLLLVWLLLPMPVYAAEEGYSADGLIASFEERRRAIAAMMEAATVWVVAMDDNSLWSGSGFVVGNGYIMTNAHVVNKISQGRGQIWVTNDNLRPTQASLVKMSYSERDISGSDYALLKFNPSVKLPMLSFNVDVRRMDRVSAWGYPDMITKYDKRSESIYGNPSRMTPPPVVYTEGTVSTIVHDSAGSSIIHTAAIAAGNSGGPLINHLGQVVGINTWGATDEGEGAFVNASLPAAEMVKFMRQNGVEPQIGGTMLASAPSLPSSNAGAPAPSSPAPPSSAPDRPAPPLENTPRLPSTSQDNLAMDSRISGGDAGRLLEQAGQGDVDAMALAGFAYLSGDDGFPEDYQRSLYWLQLAAKNNEPYSMGVLGMLYLLDPDIRNPEQALSLLKASSQYDDADPAVQAFLGTVLYEGGESLGVPFDPDESLRWAQVAAGRGNATGKALLGFHYYDGFAVEVDEARAESLAKEALGENDAKGMALMALINYESGKYDNNLKPVIDMASQAADEGEAIAQGLLARIYAFDSNYENKALAEKWGRLASGQADSVGQYVMGWLYMNGYVVEKNLSMAWAYLNLSDQKLHDMEVDSRGALLAIVEQQMSEEDMRKGRQIQRNWFVDWGLAQS